MCIWKQWKKPRTKYKNLVKLGIPEHYAATIANSRRKYWYISNNKAVIWALNKERLINSGFYDLATAYQSVHVNYWKRRIPNGTYGAVRGRRLATASYSIYIFLWFSCPYESPFYILNSLICGRNRCVINHYGKTVNGCFLDIDGVLNSSKIIDRNFDYPELVISK